VTGILAHGQGKSPRAECPASQGFGGVESARNCCSDSTWTECQRLHVSCSVAYASASIVRGPTALTHSAACDDQAEGSFGHKTLNAASLLRGHVPRPVIVTSYLGTQCDVWRNRQDELRALAAPPRAEIVLTGTIVVERQYGVIRQRPFGVTRWLDSAPAVLANEAIVSYEHSRYRRQPRSA
jgi:hypothetical protein